jgi:hypothetical protein
MQSQVLLRVCHSFWFKLQGCSKYSESFSDDMHTIDMDLGYDFCLVKISSLCCICGVWLPLINSLFLSMV